MLPKLPGSEFLLSKIDQMAHLVLANPNITARELAGKLATPSQSQSTIGLTRQVSGE